MSAWSLVRTPPMMPTLTTSMTPSTLHLDSDQRCVHNAESLYHRYIIGALTYTRLVVRLLSSQLWYRIYGPDYQRIMIIDIVVGRMKKASLGRDVLYCACGTARVILNNHRGSILSHIADAVVNYVIFGADTVIGSWINAIAQQLAHEKYVHCGRDPPRFSLYLGIFSEPVTPHLRHFTPSVGINPEYHRRQERIVYNMALRFARSECIPPKSRTRAKPLRDVDVFAVHRCRPFVEHRRSNASNYCASRRRSQPSTSRLGYQSRSAGGAFHRH